MKIGNFTYSDETALRFNGYVIDELSGEVMSRTKYKNSNFLRRGIESMLSERLKLEYGDIFVIEEGNEENRYYTVNIYAEPDGDDVLLSIKKDFIKKYSKEDFDQGPEVFVEQVIIDYIFRG
jgi:hypothetical protein